jgi:hypothetical protein
MVNGRAQTVHNNMGWRYLSTAVVRCCLIGAGQEDNYGSVSSYRRMVNSGKRFVTALQPKAAKIDFCQFRSEVTLRGNTQLCVLGIEGCLKRNWVRESITRSCGHRGHRSR